MLNRDRSSQDITVVYDVTGKESFIKVKIRLVEINKHVSDGVNKDRENQRSERLRQIRSWGVRCHGHTSGHIEKEMTKNPTFVLKEIDTQNTNVVMTVLIIRKTSRSRAFSEQLMMGRTTERITDVSCGNTASFVGIDQVFDSLTL